MMFSFHVGCNTSMGGSDGEERNLLNERTGEGSLWFSRVAGCWLGSPVSFDIINKIIYLSSKDIQISVNFYKL